MEESQLQEAERLLRSGVTMTNLEAMNLMKNKTMNFPKVVFYLRLAKVPVEDAWEMTETGKRIKRYFIRAAITAA